MKEFSYRATDLMGNTIDDSIRAENLDNAVNELQKKNLRPIEVFEKQSTNTTNTALEATSSSVYFPLLDTLRLYAGWLLAWYCLVYAIGSYQFLHELPYRIPYAESLFLSPLVLSFTFAAFLFLLLSGLYKLSGKNKALGIVLLVIGVLVFYVFRINT